MTATLLVLVNAEKANLADIEDVGFLEMLQTLFDNVRSGEMDKERARAAIRLARVAVDAMQLEFEMAKFRGGGGELPASYGKIFH